MLKAHRHVARLQVRGVHDESEVVLELAARVPRIRDDAALLIDEDDLEVGDVVWPRGIERRVGDVDAVQPHRLEHDVLRQESRTEDHLPIDAREVKSAVRVYRGCVAGHVLHDIPRILFRHGRYADNLPRLVRFAFEDDAARHRHARGRRNREIQDVSCHRHRQRCELVAHRLTSRSSLRGIRAHLEGVVARRHVRHRKGAGR